MALEQLLFQRVHPAWTTLAVCAIAGVGVLDYVTGPEITFSVFYLVPVATVAWLAGTPAAVGASAFASATWLAADALSSRVHVATLVYAWNFCARLLFLLLVAVLLAGLRRMLLRERALSRTDPLTGLPNARAFRELAESEIARAHRYGEPLSLAFVDVDDFKQVNDRRGHAAGDALLACIARTLRSHVRASDVVARYGGDEYVLLLPVTNEAAARVVVAKLLEETLHACGAEGGPASLSIGIVTCEGGRPSVDALLDRADRLMYDVKTAGKNAARFETFSA